MGNYKLLFIVCHGINKLGGGIGKKIRAQVQAFETIGVQTSLSYLEVDKSGHYIGRIVNEHLIENFQPVLGKQFSWIWRVKFRSLLSHIEQHQINIVYIRYTHFANPFFIRFLKKIKKKKILILLEIPTYPYDAEFKPVKFSDRLLKKVERIYRRHFFKYIDRIVTFSNETEIFGVKTINIHNGIALSSINIKKPTSDKKDIHLIAVAVMNIWHGYDRLIKGMNLYYQNRPETNVYLHIVGDGEDEESERYREMASTYGLEKYVLFNGFCTGETLDKLFDQSDLGIGPLGFHRVQVNYITPIKLGEYTARGVPFVYSGTNHLFDNQPFVYKVPPDESLVPVEELVDFIKRHKFNQNEIRKFAEDNLTWEKQMQKIMDEVSKLGKGM